MKACRIGKPWPGAGSTQGRHLSAIGVCSGYFSPYQEGLLPHGLGAGAAVADQGRKNERGQTLRPDPFGRDVRSPFLVGLLPQVDQIPLPLQNLQQLIKLQANMSSVR